MKPDGIAGNILIVDDLQENLALIAGILDGRGHKVRLATSGKGAIASAKASVPDLVLMDINMPGMDGFQACEALKSEPVTADVPVIFLTAQSEVQDIVRAFSIGAADYVSKPFRREELVARVETQLKLGELKRELLKSNRELERMVELKVREIAESQMATIKVLASQAEFRDNETGRHVRRVQEFCNVLGRGLLAGGGHPGLVDERWVNTLVYASVLHDIGKVGIPDNILLKSSALDKDESEIMKTHTVIGARNMEEARRSYPNNDFINMGIDIALCHHERYDGGGYPRGLAGASIPLSARVMNLADQYDALRSHRPYKGSIDHDTTCAIIIEGDGRTKPDHFDPEILAIFRNHRDEFAELYGDLSD